MRAASEANNPGSPHALDRHAERSNLQSFPKGFTRDFRFGQVYRHHPMLDVDHRRQGRERRRGERLCAAGLPGHVPRLFSGYSIADSTSSRDSVAKVVA
jgi:hypothetical protein